MKKLLILTASIVALTSGQAYANNSTVNQTGDENTATVDQTAGVEGMATINQNTDESTASIIQRDGPPQSAGFSVASNVASINQNGDQFQDATIEQDATVEIGRAHV